MAQTSGLAAIVQAFRNRRYRLYQLGRFSSLITTWMYKVALGWIVWDLTHSAAWLGFLGFIDLAPALVIMPIAGAVADRMDSLKVLRITQILLLLQAAALSLLIAFDMAGLWVLIGLTFFHGIVHAAQQPASQTIMPAIVEKSELTAAYGLNSLTFNVSRLIGPAIAGLVINFWGTGPAVFANAIGAAGFCLCLTAMGTNFTFPTRKSQRKGKASTRMMGDITEGFAYAIRHPGIGPTVLILSTLSIFPFTIDLLLPSLADGVYGEGAHGLAWMTSIMGAGAMCLAYYIAQRGGIEGLTGFIGVSILVLGIAFVVLAVADWFWLALVCIYFIGFTCSAIRVGSMTLLQYSVDADMRGRVASIYGLINNGGPALGSLIVGFFGDRFGIPATMGGVGVATLIVWAYARWRQEIMSQALEHEAPAKPGGAG